jgi:hypothetical protein
MANFFNESMIRRARKDHECTYCGELIEKGSDYTFQDGHHDGSWFTSKMHDECFDDFCTNGDGEYTMYDNERPVKAEA